MVDLGRKVNSRYHDAAPIISPDGNTLYFFIANHPENTYGIDNSQDIWYTQKDENGEWQESRHMEAPLNKHHFNQVLTVLDNGNTLFLRGGRGNDDSGFSLSSKKNGRWTSPVPIMVKGYERMKKGIFSGGVISIDKKVILLYFSETESSKSSDIYVSFFENTGTYSRPVMIGPPISTSRDEFGPFLTADTKTMYFASNRWGGLGSADIYKTQRLDDSWMKWSEPENIGPPVNTDGFDAYFSMDESGKNAFTTRAFMSADGGHLNIIGLLPEPEIILSGTVRNKKTNQPVPVLLDYLAIEKDTGNINTDQKGFYKLSLRHRAVYYFQAFKEGYEFMRDSIDLTKADDKARIEKDLYLTPEKAELILSGTIYEEDTEYPLDADINISFNNISVISTRSDAIKGYYQTRLSGSGNYTVDITREGYNSLTDTLNLFTNASYAEFERNFHLMPEIELTGYVNNEKDHSPLVVDVSYGKDNNPLGSFTTDNAGYYHIILPEKGKYYFHAFKDGFINLSDSIEINYYNPRDGLMKDLYMTPIEIGVTVRLNNIFFDFDKSFLRSESFPELDRVVHFMNLNPTIHIEIRGHTDNMGSDAYNAKLSQGRSEAVRAYLLEQGIPAERVEANGYGESLPQATNDTEEGRQINRRVEFRILEK